MKSAALIRVDDRTKGIVVKNRTYHSVNGGSHENKPTALSNKKRKELPELTTPGNIFLIARPENKNKYAHAAKFNQIYQNRIETSPLVSYQRMKLLNLKPVNSDLTTVFL